MTDIEVARYALRTFRWNFVHNVFGPLAHVACNDLAWRDGTCTAKCLRAEYLHSRPSAVPPPPNHRSPHIRCTCGIYGSLDWHHLYFQYPVEASKIIAVIAAEGKTIIGTRGLRTQCARVVAYWCGYDGPPLAQAERQFRDAQRFDPIKETWFDPIKEMLEVFNLPEMRSSEGENPGKKYWA